MKVIEIRIIAKIALLIFLYFVTYAFYNGLLNPVPALGDSWAYHIPISKTILNGTFLYPINFELPQWYYPGSSEAINSVFLLLGIPLTLSNLFAVCILFYSCWMLGITFKLNFYYALLFAVAFCSLNVIVRWFNAVSIDIWVAVFFCWALILLENPKKSVIYFLKLGFFFGMIIGSKYSAIIYAVILIVVYVKNIYKYLNFQRVVAFMVPFSIFGLFWYIRNYLSIGNPFYPMEVLGFPGINVFNSKVIYITASYPLDMFNALFGEFKLWSFVLLIPAIYYGLLLHRIKMPAIYGINRLFVIGILGLCSFLFFPTSKEVWIMVSSFRYSYPVFIVIILGTFILAQKYNQRHNLGYFVIANMIMVTSFAYYPKLILFYMPIAFICFYLMQRHDQKIK